MENNNIPKAFKGMPAALIAASIVSLSFAGFRDNRGIFAEIP